MFPGQGCKKLKDIDTHTLRLWILCDMAVLLLPSHIASRMMVNGIDNQRETTIDSVVEGVLDRASADILTDSSLSSSDDDNDSPLVPNDRHTEVR